MTTGRRVHERYDRRLKVVVQHEGGHIECVTRNISLGGMYLVTQSSLPYGTPVELEIYLPALKEDVTIGATVRWTKPDGMGVQFGSLRAREVWALNQLFKQSELVED
ncbi:MAG TPA: PilZ domain-containing protein [Sandaracinaceae bacterium LLY-WYZ-13_1]|nr:PilZ domain-containing protein [Sandaracinaceae bacterium LLY-WYZ-13_1]